MADWFGNMTLIKKDHSIARAEEALSDQRYILILFSAKWAPPCTPFVSYDLRDFFDEAEPKGVSIIWVSSDRSREDFEMNFLDNHADYYSVKFGDPNVNRLKILCNARGIPKLTLVTRDGRVVDENVKDLIGKMPAMEVLKKLDEKLKPFEQ